MPAITDEATAKAIKQHICFYVHFHTLLHRLLIFFSFSFSFLLYFLIIACYQKCHGADQELGKWTCYCTKGGRVRALSPMLDLVVCGGAMAVLCDRCRVAAEVVQKQCRSVDGVP